MQVDGKTLCSQVQLCEEWRGQRGYKESRGRGAALELLSGGLHSTGVRGTWPRLGKVHPGATEESDGRRPRDRHGRPPTPEEEACRGVWA